MAGHQVPSKKERNDRILLRKVKTTPEDLCRGLPQELLEYYQMCQRLQYSEQPPYSELQSLIRGALTRRHLQYDLIFDWIGASTSDDSSCRAESEPLSSRSRDAPAKPDLKRKAADLKRKAGDHRGGPHQDSPCEGIKQSKIEPR